MQARTKTTYQVPNLTKREEQMNDEEVRIVERRERKGNNFLERWWFFLE